MLQWNGSIYELFEYIEGTTYDSSIEATADAGRVLALFHKLLADFRPRYEPAVGSYHAARSVRASLRLLPQALATAESNGADRRAAIDRIAQSM